MKSGLYQHYKGQEYEVLGVCRHSETLEEMIVYRALYSDYGLWVRPKALFEEVILYKGKKTPRFQFIRPLNSEAPAIRQ